MRKIETQLQRAKINHTHILIIFSLRGNIFHPLSFQMLLPFNLHITLLYIVNNN